MNCPWLYHLTFEHVTFKSMFEKHNRPVTESLIYLYSQQPLACGVGSCQNGGSCVEECDGNRKCICTGGYTGAHCENTLPVEILRKKLNRKLLFVLILSMYVIIYQCIGCFQQPCIGASGAKPSSQLPISIHIQCTQPEYSSKVVGESTRTFLVLKA